LYHHRITTALGELVLVACCGTTPPYGDRATQATIQKIPRLLAQPVYIYLEAASLFLVLRFPRLLIFGYLSVMALPSLFEIILLVLFSVNLYLLSQRASPSSDAAHKSGPTDMPHSSGPIAREEKETSSTCHAPAPSPTCFRVSNIPSAWNAGDLLKWTQTLDPSWNSDECRISLYPSYHGSGQTALLNTKHCPARFAGIDRGKAKTITAKDEASGKELILSVDYDFYNLTPLNEPKGDIVAELAPTFAITSLIHH